ncbi:peptidoglycan/LPS O-acetylase OafA/YrhL [Cryobacterium sp. MP_3.1]|uniref:acyltransferase family protein n=1 Tax=Cryobacterium sp. MP_3.1 TaxID=3071711 RepID=UPI002DF7EE6F|nr:peptidoglycan/LPS O-acetylase OafA/YrhL [Cryobacterium sp. MP_3.1]
MQGKRLDIQGLRAIAVALVVVFHVWPRYLPGGYVGVDVFFVISGFLITSHLLSEVQRTGTVGLAKFWARRIRRLLPAAFTVLGASLLAALVFVPKSLLQQTLNELGASALYVQNWVLAGSSVDYLGADNKPTLAQHFWSLSVEEQFYLAWPIIILIAVWVASKIRRTDEVNRKAVGIALTIVFALSLAYSIFETARSQPSAYFSTFTRAWEFAGGGLLAFFPTWAVSGTRPRLDSALRQIAGWGGLGLILYAALRFSAESQFPGYIALIPVVGSMLLLHAGQRETRWTPGWLVKASPVQLVGDTSYAIYLWHWPLIVLFPFVLGHDLTLAGKLGILAVTLVLAVATKLVIEDPVRKAKKLAARQTPSYAFMAAGILVLTTVTVLSSIHLAATYQSRAETLDKVGVCLGAGAINTKNGCDAPFAITESVDPGYASSDLYWNEGSALAGGGCQPEAGSVLATCELGAVDNPDLTIAVIGNSHGEHMVEPLALASKAQNWRLIPHVRARCSGLESAEEIEQRSADSSIAEDQAECYKWGHAVIDSLAQRADIDAVIISASGVSANPEATAQIQRLVDAGKAVVMLGDSPALPGATTAAECVEASKVSYDPCSWIPVALAETDAAIAEARGIPYIDISSNFCSADGRCHAVIGGLITYFDSHHMTLDFSRTLAPFLAAQISSALADAGLPRTP